MTDGLSVSQAEHWLDQFDPKRNGFEISREDKFPNGFNSWCATYFEIAVNLDPAREGSHAYFRYLVEGREGLHGLAREMVTKFENESREGSGMVSSWKRSVDSVGKANSKKAKTG